MLRKIIVIVSLLSALALIALAPATFNPSGDYSADLQASEVPTVGATVVVVTSTSTSGGGSTSAMPTTTLVIIGLLVILGIAVIVGGIGLMRR